MLTIHHLRVGRSIFCVWLLEELGLKYELVEYYRNPETMRAPPELKNIHPLGKSPVIDDDGLILSESGAITSYLIEKHGRDTDLCPSRSDLEKWAEYSQWLHYPEGSVFAPLLIKMLSLRSPEPENLFQAFADPEVKLHLDYISNRLSDQSYILGEEFTAADFGITYVLSLAERLGQLTGYNNLQAYLKRNTNRPAFLKAIERAEE